VLPRRPVPLLTLLDDLPTLTRRRAALLSSDQVTGVGPASIGHEPTRRTALDLHGGARARGALLLHLCLALATGARLLQRRLAFAASHVGIGRRHGSTQKVTRCWRQHLGGGLKSIHSSSSSAKVREGVEEREKGVAEGLRDERV
jgi:hypothetical protein